jgi:hypothetical protein
MNISPEVYAELRKFVREQGGAPEEEGEEMGGMSAASPAGVEIEVKSEPEGGAKTCPACGQHVP